VNKDVWFEEPLNFRGSGAIVKFFGRVGGTSTEPYESLNASYKVGDNPDSVRQNRKIIADIVQVPPENLVTVGQEHGTKVIEVNATFSGTSPLADGMYTANPDIALCILTADCIPLFAFAPDKKILLAAHIGWRGALGRFGELIINNFNGLGAKPKDLLLAFGPSIKGGCYRVDMDFYRKFKDGLGKDYPIEKYFSTIGGNLYFDLTEIILDQLERSGVSKSQIYVSPYCTHCMTDLFFSYRRDGQKSGRQISCGRVLLP